MVNVAALADDNRILTGERDEWKRRHAAIAADLAQQKATNEILAAEVNRLNIVLMCAGDGTTPLIKETNHG
jgi:hypothetical protein